MKRFFCLFISALLLLTALFGIMEQPSHAVELNPLLEIGLFYGTNALAAANLQNAAGDTEGYDVGWFDQSTRAFFKVFTTDEKYITVLKNETLWVTSSNTYYDVMPSSFVYVIGACHLQSPESYMSLSEALEFVSVLDEYLGLKAYPAYINGEYFVRTGNYEFPEDCENDRQFIKAYTGIDFVSVEESASCYSVSVTGTDTILFEFDNACPLGIKPKSSTTWFRGNRYNGGFEYDRRSGGNMTVSNVVKIDDYIRGVVPSEVYSSWPIEALKVEAICAKCFALNTIGRHSNQGFDLCNTEDCQVYTGIGNANENTNAAVDGVSGYFVTYAGSIIPTYYHSSSGGYTENSENVWSATVPYLKAVEDTYLDYGYEMAIKAGYLKQPLTYSYTLTISQLNTLAAEKGITSEKVVGVYVKEFTEAGNVKRVAFVTESGNEIVYSKERARTIFNNSSINGLRAGSMRFTITAGGGTYINDEKYNSGTYDLYAIGNQGVQKMSNQDLTGAYVLTSNGTEVIGSGSDTFTLRGYGSGHNIGLSSWGSYGMAMAGFTYDQIVQYYFTGTDITFIEESVTEIPDTDMTGDIIEDE